MLPTCFIVALPAEARPLVKFFGLRALAHPHLRLYQGDNTYLLQCGLGKLNAAAGTAAMLQTLPNVRAIINIGIAGSEQPIGDALIAHGVQDMASGQQWFPHLPSTKRLGDVRSAQVVTVDRPETDYSPEQAFDMEAAGIFSAATKVLDLAFVHSIKVVSDNTQSGIQQINADSVVEQIGNVVPCVENLLQSLPFDTLPDSDTVNAMSAWLTKRLHYSATETHALNQMLHRYAALIGDLPTENTLNEFDTAKSVRQHLLLELNNASINY